MKEKFFAYSPYLVFLGIFTALFLFCKALFLYLLPFIISLLIAVVMRPLYQFLKKKFAFQPAFSATVITLLIFSVMLAVLGFVFYMIVRELLGFFTENAALIEKIVDDLNLTDRLNTMLFSGDFMEKLSFVLSNVAKTVPAVITFFIFAFVSSVYFLNHIGDLKNAFLKRLPAQNREVVRATLDTAYLLVRKFIRSYMILYLITFVEAAFIFILTEIPYPLVFAFLAAVADLLPVLGPGAVYVPIVVLAGLKGHYLTAGTLGVFYLITVIIRQVLEPKIVSDSVKISSMFILAAIYFSVVSMNVWVLFYMLLLVLTYKILTEARILDPLF